MTTTAKQRKPHRDSSCTGPSPCSPSGSVLRAYAKDLRKHGKPLDSGLPGVLERTADRIDAMRAMLLEVADHGDCGCWQDDDCPFVRAKCMANAEGHASATKEPIA